jgi:hypothetical protein
MSLYYYLWHIKAEIYLLLQYRFKKKLHFLTKFSKIPRKFLKFPQNENTVDFSLVEWFLFYGWQLHKETSFEISVESLQMTPW